MPSAERVPARSMRSFWLPASPVVAAGRHSIDWSSSGGRPARLLQESNIGAAAMAATRVVSPRRFNPLYLNSLRSILTELIDFETLQSRYVLAAVFTHAEEVQAYDDAKRAAFPGRTTATQLTPQSRQHFPMDGQH